MVLIHAVDPILYVVILSLYSVDLFIYEVGSLLFLDVRFYDMQLFSYSMQCTD